MVVSFNFSLTKFESKTVNLTVSGGCSGMSGMSLVFTVRNRFAGESGLVSKTLDATHVAGESGLTIVNQVSGTIGVGFGSSDTSGLIPKDYVYDLVRTTSGRLVTVQGHIALLPPVGTP